MTLLVLEHPHDKHMVSFVGMGEIVINDKRYETEHDFFDEEEQKAIIKYFKINKPHLCEEVEKEINQI